MSDEFTGDWAVLHPPDVHRATVGPIMRPRASATPQALGDDIDGRLIDLLLADSKISNRELALRVDISESAVSVRLRKLINAGLLVFTAVIDWEAAGFEWFVICRITTRARSPRVVAGEVGSLAQCLAAAVTMGSHDVAAYFLAADRQDLGRLIDAVSAVDGVADVEVTLGSDAGLTGHGARLFMAVDVPEIRLSVPRTGVDGLDIAILQTLVEDGRQSSRNIGRLLEVSEGTVRARISRMTQSGLLRIAAMVEPFASGHAGVIAAIAIRAERVRVDAIVDELATNPKVAVIARCVGNCDLHITMLADDPAELVELVGAQVQSIEGVLSTDMTVFVEVLRYNPYLSRHYGA